MVLPDLYGEFFSELMRGIDQVARESNTPASKSVVITLERA